MTTALWVIRPYDQKVDEAFIVKSWLQSYSSYFLGSRVLIEDYLAKVNPALGGQMKDAFFKEFHPQVEETLEHAVTFVAVMPDEPTVILGFVVAERHSTGPMVVHFVYTRSRYRNLGIARALFNTMRAHLNPSDPQLIITATTPFVRLQAARLNAVNVPLYTFLGREERQAK